MKMHIGDGGFATAVTSALATLEQASGPIELLLVQLTLG